jgi:hypothetical protein
VSLSDRDPISAEPVAPNAEVFAWTDVLGQLTKRNPTYWLLTVTPDATPQTMPVLAVWVDGGLYFSAASNTRKDRNLTHNARCVATVEHEHELFDLVVEGTAAKIRDFETLTRVAAAYASVYGSHPTVRDGALHDTWGAPTAGPPPYDVYEVIPAVAFGFGIEPRFPTQRQRLKGPTHVEWFNDRKGRRSVAPIPSRQAPRRSRCIARRRCRVLLTDRLYASARQGDHQAVPPSRRRHAAERAGWLAIQRGR